MDMPRKCFFAQGFSVYLRLLTRAIVVALRDTSMHLILNIGHILAQQTHNVQIMLEIRTRSEYNDKTQ